MSREVPAEALRIVKGVEREPALPAHALEDAVYVHRGALVVGVVGGGEGSVALCQRGGPARACMTPPGVVPSE